MSAAPVQRGFRFAAKCSGNSNLYKAIYEVVQSVEQQLAGRTIDFCQLLVTTAHNRNLAHAPECLLDHLHRWPQHSDLGHGRQQQRQQRHHPTLIGGAVQAVGGAGRHLDPGSAGVSLLAASLPGVQLMPFHVPGPSLPPLTAQQWETLLQQQQQQSAHSPEAGESGTAAQHHHGSVAILLSAPHFVEIELLLARLSNVLPDMPVVGGVTESNAWLDTESSYGALFLNDSVHASGAVGCILHGPIVLHQLLLPSCRPGGGVMTVTEASGNAIYELDDEPVRDSFVSLLHSLDEQDQKRELQLGLDLSSSNGSRRAAPAVPSSDEQQQQQQLAETSLWHQQHPFVARGMSLAAAGVTGQPVLRVAVPEVPVGTRVQLQVRDYAQNWKQQERALQELARRLPPAEAAGQPTALSSAPQQQPAATPPEAAAPAGSGGIEVALLGYCCVALPHDESALVQELLPQVPFAAARMQGEAAAGGQLHSYAASYALLCHSDKELF